VVNPDSIRLALHGQVFQTEAEGFVWAIAKVMVRSLFLSGHDTVVLDATNTTIKRQEDWNDTEGSLAEYTVKFKVFHTPAGECKKRAVEDGKEFLIPVIDRMREGCQHPPTDRCL
jgi:predicted kinase